MAASGDFFLKCDFRYQQLIVQNQLDLIAPPLWLGSEAGAQESGLGKTLRDGKIIFTLCTSSTSSLLHLISWNLTCITIHGG